MQTLLKSSGLVLALLALISLLILLPAAQLGVIEDRRIILLAIGYFSFFLGTVWRVIRYGDLVERDKDLQVKQTAGKIASLVTVVGLIGGHWLTIYTFATNDRSPNLAVDNYTIWAGTSLVIAAIIVSQIAINTLGKFFDRLTIKTDHRLVTEGIYRSVRHPIYTSYILLFLGFCIALQSLWGLAGLVGVCLIWFGNRIGIEEQMLADRFGDDYLAYCQTTKRLFTYIY
jgi:protein-S-isoprenylcysteine O-methyltransferase Ste14